MDFFIAPLQNMDGGAWQYKYINVNIQAYNDTKNKVKNGDNTHISSIKKRQSVTQSILGFSSGWSSRRNAVGLKEKFRL